MLDWQAPPPRNGDRDGRGPEGVDKGRDGGQNAEMTAKRKPQHEPLAASVPVPSNYDVDFYAWAYEQSALLRAGRLSAADIDNIAEEIATLGRSEKRELVNRLIVLLMHLLKWQFQPEKRSRSWEVSIKDQRRQTGWHLRDNPSLKYQLAGSIAEAYESAVEQAGLETGLPDDAFPKVCPYSPEKMMSADFWPE